MLRTPIGRVRFTGKVEGISFLLLLGVARPLKYFADMPMAVRYVGMIHGILFLVFCGVLGQAFAAGALSLTRSLTAFSAAVIPFGPFFIDRSLAEAEAPSADLGPE